MQPRCDAFKCRFTMKTVHGKLPAGPMPTTLVTHPPLPKLAELVPIYKV